MERDDPGVEIPTPTQLLELVRSLPGMPAVLDELAIGPAPGVFLVGGAVRDLLSGGHPLDLDLVVEGPAEPLVQRLEGQARLHDRFSTATVTLGPLTLDFARSRRETYPRPGALPEVEPADLDEDLRRRDFTVNAIAVALNGPDVGRLAAAPHAIEDLEGRRLRVLHDESFRDDPTRLLRLIRYLARLGYQIEPGTLALIRAAVADRALDTVSGARIGNELRLVAAEGDPIAALRAMRELDIDQAIDPGLGLTEPALAGDALELLDGHGRRDLLALAMAARAIEPERLRILLDRLAFAASDRDRIVEIVEQGPALAQRLAAAARPSEIADAVGSGGPELVALAGALGTAAPARRWLEDLRHLVLEISGDDLIAAGVEPGPPVGAGLRAARSAALDGRANTREEQLGEALRAARGEE